MKKILVVDDDRGIREAISVLLRRKGCGIVTVANSEEALERLDESFQLVISDLQMPGHGGLWLAAQIRNKFRGGMPVIIMTGALGEIYRCTKEMGVSGVLPKPFDCQDLIDKVSRYVKL